MSSHPQIERLSESVKTTVNKYIGFIDANVPGAMRKGFAKSVIWTIASLVAIALPIAIIQQTQPGNHWIENASRIALAILASAFGQNLNLFGAIGMGGATISVGAHPALLTILIALFAFKAGKSFSKNTEIAADAAQSRRFAIGLGFGSAFALLASTWALQGALGWGTTYVSLGMGSFFDFAIAFFLVAFPAWMGGKFGEKVTVLPTVWGWARRATLNFVVLYSAILAVALVVGVVFNLIAPHFAPSQPATHSSSNIDFGQLALAVIVALAFLPNLLLMAFGAGSSMSVGLSLNAGQGQDALLSGIQGYLPVPLPTSFSINSAYGIILFSIVLAVVGVVAMISGAAASKKTGYRPTTGVSFVQSLFTVVIIGIFATYLGNFSGSWTMPATGSTAAINGSASFGIVLASFALVVTLLVTGAWVAASKVAAGVETAFPRAVGKLAAMRAAERTQKGWVTFGRLATAGLVLGLIVYPITSATVSRVWATTDSPSVIGEKLSQSVLNEKLEKIKSVVGPTVKDEQWIADEVLQKALPKSDDELKIAVKNNQGKAWVVGNTDATVSISWSRGDATSKWLVPTSSKVTNHFLLVDHPNFKSKAAPLFLDIKVNAFISAKNRAELKVNGVSVVAGNYAVVPGFYKITLPGQDLISPTDITIATDGTKTAFIAGNSAVIPEGGEEKLNKSLETKQAKCKKISDKGSASCFNAKTMASNVTSQTSPNPSKYFDSTTSGYKLTSLTCDDKTTDALISSKMVGRSQACHAVTTFTKTFYKTATVRKTQSMGYWDVCYDYYYDEYYDCWTDLGTYTRTVKVRGAKLKTVTYTSEFDVTLSARGTLKGGKFTVK